MAWLAGFRGPQDIVGLMVSEKILFLSYSYCKLMRAGCDFVLFVLLLYVPSQQLWSLWDGQFTSGQVFCAHTFTCN